MEYEKKVLEINNSEEYVPYLTAEEDNRKLMNTIIKESKEQGHQEEKIRIMKALFEQGISLDVIAKVNNKTIKEVKDILKIS